MATVKRTKEDESLTILTVSGVITCGEIINALEDFTAHDVTPYLLWDFTDADGSQITKKDMEKIIAFAQSKAHLRENGKTALLVPQDFSFGLSRMYEILSEILEHPIQHNVFRDRIKAISWIKSNE